MRTTITLSLHLNLSIFNDENVYVYRIQPTTSLRIDFYLSHEPIFLRADSGISLRFPHNMK